MNTWLRFSMLGPKLYINTIQVSIPSCLFNMHFASCVSHSINVLVNYKSLNIDSFFSFFDGR